ncbi:hypothetical protein RP20_CCG016082 [Aedes albopictus]|nr:hypothetical protein RP20_CCG016082 [Aedes albopictus]
MGGTKSKEENTAHTHGNQLVTVIQTQDVHSTEHQEQQTLLHIILVLQTIIILILVAKMIHKTMRKRWMKKGIRAAQSIATLDV